MLNLQFLMLYMAVDNSYVVDNSLFIAHYK